MRDKNFWMNIIAAPFPGNVVGCPVVREMFAEIDFMWQTPQDPEWHPEGDVGSHTVFVTNEAAVIADRESLSPRDRAVLVFAALLHDIAKPPTTELKERNGVMRITSEGHEKAGGPIARRIMEEMCIDEDIIAEVVPLIENHLAHILFADNNKPADRVLRRLRKRLEPSNVRMLAWLIEADVSGRPPLPKQMPESAKRLVELIENLSPDEPPRPECVLQGRHLIELGVQPGPQMGAILKEVAAMEQAGHIDGVDEAIEFAKKLITV